MMNFFYRQRLNINGELELHELISSVGRRVRADGCVRDVMLRKHGLRMCTGRAVRGEFRLPEIVIGYADDRARN